MVGLLTHHNTPPDPPHRVPRETGDTGQAKPGQHAVPTLTRVRAHTVTHCEHACWCDGEISVPSKSPGVTPTCRWRQHISKDPSRYG